MESLNHPSVYIVFSYTWRVDHRTGNEYSRDRFIIDYGGMAAHNHEGIVQITEKTVDLHNALNPKLYLADILPR